MFGDVAHQAPRATCVDDKMLDRRLLQCGVNRIQHGNLLVRWFPVCSDSKGLTVDRIEAAINVLKNDSDVRIRHVAKNYFEPESECESYISFAKKSVDPVSDIGASALLLKIFSCRAPMGGGRQPLARRLIECARQPMRDGVVALYNWCQL